VVIGQDSDLRRKQAILLHDFLETQMRETENGLRDAELALASFMAVHPRFALDTTPFATGAAIRASLGRGAAEPAQVQGARTHGLATTRRPAPEASAAGAPNTIVAVGPIVPRELAAEVTLAKAGLAAAQANLMDLTARFTAAHPDVRAAEAEVDRANRRVEAAIATEVSAEARSSPATSVGQPTPALPTARPEPLPKVPVPNNPVRIESPAMRAFVAPERPGGSGSSDHDVVALETEWVRLTRGATEARHQQDQVEAALFKARSAAHLETGDHGVQVTTIDPAFLPQSAVPPGRSTVIALFAGVSLLLSVAWALLKALLDDRIYEERDFSQVARVLVAVPRRSHAARS
jgi:hypothetical protein